MANPLFDRLFARHAGSSAPFLAAAPTGPSSYADFLARAETIAGALSWLPPGERVAAQVEKSADALALWAACARQGLVFLPLNTAYTTSELAYFLEDSEAALVISDPDREAALRPIAERAGARLETLGTRGEGSLLGGPRRDPGAIVPRLRSDLAAILYTSGTTGRSKGAMLSQENLLSNAETLAELWRFDARDVLLHALPIFHTHGLFVATHVALIAGASMIFLPKFDLDAVFEALPRATSMMGVPTFYSRMLADPRLSRESAAHIRLFVSGSAPLPADAHRAFERRTGHAILERYGMTETNMIASNPYDGERRPGAVGFALPGVEVRIAGRETGAPSSDVGEIETRGPNVFLGYWRMEEKTKAEMREGGFFATGDLGRFDEAGYLQIVGRAKDLIISGGYNVYPKEIEELLDRQDGVAESAVIGAPHADLGETPIAILVAEPDREPDIAAIEARVAEALARFKRPRAYRVVDRLPRNAMGKVQKAALRERWARAFSF